MRQRVTNLTLVRFAAIAALLLYSCAESRTVPVQPMLRVEPSTLEFGDVPVGMQRALTVNVFNDGAVPVQVADILTQLASPEFSINSESLTLRPGQIHPLNIEFLPLAEKPYVELLSVKTNSALDSPLDVNLVGRGIAAPISFTPSSLDFETLEIDSTRTLSVTVENPTSLPVTLALDGSPFTLSTTTVSPLSTETVELQYAPKTLGENSAEVNVSNCASCTTFSLPLRGKSVESAFVFTPSPLYFETIPVHEKTQAVAEARNITWRPVQVTAIQADSAFSALLPVGSFEAAPSSPFPLTIEYSARFPGQDVGTLEVRYLSDKPRVSKLPLDAQGGRAQLAVTPATLDFGELPAGAKASLPIRITNAGSRESLNFLGISATGDTNAFQVSTPTRGTTRYDYLANASWPTLPSAPVSIAPNGDALDMEVYFQPETPGSYRTELWVQSDAPFTPNRRVTILGSARESGPCEFVILPSEIDFGNVPAGRGAVLGFRFINVGRTECAVKDIKLTQSAEGRFFMPGGEIVGGSVPFDTWFSTQVAFRSDSSGTFEGALTLTVNSPATPQVSLPLRATSRSSCLLATPSYFDFGAIRYDCAVPTRSVRLSNRCAYPIDLTELFVGEGTSDQFSLIDAPTLPLTLESGAGVDLRAAYARDVHGQHTSPLFVVSPQEPVPFLIPMLAETNHEGLRIDRFVQGDVDQLDVLFVISNTSTMAPFQERLRGEFPRWLSFAQSLGVSLQVGVTTTGLVERGSLCPGGALGGEAGRLFPVDGSSPRIVNLGTPRALEALQSNVRVGTCHSLVQGLEAMRAALSWPLVASADDPRTALPQDGNAGFLRDAARLAVIFLVDEDDASGFPVDSYVEFLRNLKGPGLSQRVVAHALVPVDRRCPTAGLGPTRFAAVATALRGETVNICNGSYQPLLSSLLEQAAELEDTFPLSEEPLSESEIGVWVDGVEQVPTTWRYLPDRQEIQFTQAFVPAPGANIDVQYRSDCP